MFARVLAMVAGVLLLARGGHAFVIGAARISSLAGIPAVVVGAVVIGFGTGIPELFTSTLAAAQGSIGIAIGSVVGSNVVNSTLVVGVAGLIAAPVVSVRILRREAPVTLLATALFAVVIQGALSRWEGAVLVGLFAVAVVLLLRRAEEAAEATGPPDPGATRLSAEVRAEYLDEPPHRRSHEVLRTAVGLAAVLAGSQAMVWGALGVASRTGVSQGVVGVTIVAFGTSLPELASGVVAALHREPDLVIGNVLGSNLFNALVVAGLCGLIRPGRVPGGVTGGPTVLMVATMALLAAVLYRGRRINRIEATALVVVYAGTVALTVV